MARHFAGGGALSAECLRKSGYEIDMTFRKNHSCMLKIAHLNRDLAQERGVSPASKWSNFHLSSRGGSFGRRFDRITRFRHGKNVTFQRCSSYRFVLEVPVLLR